jgi:hypothetical protein
LAEKSGNEAEAAALHFCRQQDVLDLHRRAVEESNRVFPSGNYSLVKAYEEGRADIVAQVIGQEGRPNTISFFPRSQKGSKVSMSPE